MRLLVALLSISIPLLAQVDHASLNGTISDPSGAAVAGAKVDVVSNRTGLRPQATTAESGVYELPTLRVGAYTITVPKAGCRSAEFKDGQLTVGQARTID